MQLLAIAGGAGLGDEDALGFCFVFPLMPLIVFLICRAAYRTTVWPAALALVLTALPYLALRGMVANYTPSNDWEIMDDQATGLKLVGRYMALALASGMSLLYVGCRRIVRWGRSRGTNRCGSSVTVPAGSPKVRIGDVDSSIVIRAFWFLVLCLGLLLIAMAGLR